MTLPRATRFLDLEVIWQSLEASPAPADATGLAAFAAGCFGDTGLFLGVVRATGERAFWLQTTAPQPALPPSLPAAVWVKKVVQPDHTLLTVVLEDPALKADFAALAQAVLAALQQPAGNHSAAALLVAQLRQWRPAATPPLRMAA